MAGVLTSRVKVTEAVAMKDGQSSVHRSFIDRWMADVED